MRKGVSITTQTLFKIAAFLLVLFVAVLIAVLVNKRSIEIFDLLKPFLGG